MDVAHRGAAWFVGGMFISEIVFATATVDEIQPIIDGLAFDEALLGGLLVGLPVVLFTAYSMRPREAHHEVS
jgi:hypothetical protein